MTRHMKTGVAALTILVGLSLSFCVVLFAVPADAQESMRERLTKMERELNDVRDKLDRATRKASEDDVSLVKWHLAGYAHADFVATDSKDENDSFGGATFSPVFHFQYSDFILFEAEPELKVSDDGETELELEYSQINLLLHDYVTLAAGKFLSPVGQFQERLHPAWINKLPDAPAGFAHGGVQPLSEVGVQLRGGIPISQMTVTYALGVGNGPRAGHHGLELEGFGSDNNGAKSFVGRIGFLPFPYFEVGGSFLTGKAPGEAAPSGPVTSGDVIVWGADAAYTRGPWDVRFEYLNVTLDSFFGRAAHGDPTTSLIPRTEWQAWYVQAAYQLSGLTDMRIVRNFEPVVRYGKFTGEGFDEFLEDREYRLNIGLNYLFAPSVIAKGSVEWRDMKAPGVEDEFRFLMQIAYGF